MLDTWCSLCSQLVKRAHHLVAKVSLCAFVVDPHLGSRTSRCCWGSDGTITKKRPSRKLRKHSDTTTVLGRPALIDH